MSDIPEIKVGTFDFEAKYYRNLSDIFKSRISNKKDYSKYVRYRLVSLAIEKIQNGCSLEYATESLRKWWRKYCENEDHLFEQWKMAVVDMDRKIEAAAARLTYCKMTDDAEPNENIDPSLLSEIDGNIKFLHNLDALVNRDEKGKGE